MPTGIYKRTPENFTLTKWIKNNGAWNKGKKTGLVPKTAFKKGQSPWNAGTVGVVKSWNKGKKGLQKWSDAQREKMKKVVRVGIKGLVPWNKGLKGYMAGAKHYNYKPDRTEIDLNKRRNWATACIEWREKVFKRDNYKCKINNQECTHQIEAHHILSWRDYPELRFELNNGITLCKKHHPRKRDEEKKLSPYFQDLIKINNK